MARPLRVQYEGALYHVTSRGNARQRIFRDDQDRRIFLRVLEAAITRYALICPAYCLMDNHYHLLIETPKANLSLAMRHINGMYTQAFNRRHRRGGHLLQGRYQAILVEKEAHLLELSRYVVLNPVRAGAVERVEQWPWSSYRATVGKGARPPWLQVDGILERLGKTRWRAVRRYREFVKEGVGLQETPWERLTGQIYLGSDAFIQGLRMGSQAETFSEIPWVQRRPARASLVALLRRGGTVEEIERAMREGYKQVEIARHLGVHYTTVSMRVKRGGRREGGSTDV